MVDVGKGRANARVCFGYGRVSVASDADVNKLNTRDFLT